MRIFLVTATLLFSSTVAIADDLAVSVRDRAGRPVADAVVTVRPARRAPAAPIRFAWALQMSQHRIAFDPHVLIVPVGSEVTFPNKDKVRHHVYSFSATKKFEIKLYGREETRRVLFDKPGVVPLGCNIHDQMIGYVYVVDTPHVAKTAASGEALVRNLPAGAATMTVWSPTARKSVSLPVSGARQTVVLDLRPGSAS